MGMKQSCSLKYKKIIADIKSVFKKGNGVRIIVTDSDLKTVLNLPIIAIVLISLIAPFLMIVFAALGYVLKYKVSVK